MTLKEVSLTFFSIPWPTIKQKAKNMISVFSKTKGVYYKLDGFFFLWTPLVTHDKAEVSVAITDRRGKTGKPVVVNKVTFQSHNVTMSAMSVGNCVHQDDLNRVELSVSLSENIASKGAKYATLEACFYISISTRASLETHSVIAPLVVPPEVKNLVKNYKKVAEYLKGSNARVIKKIRRDSENKDLENELNGREERVGPNLAEEKVRILSRRMTAKPSTQFGLSEVNFREG